MTLEDSRVQTQLCAQTIVLLHTQPQLCRVKFLIICGKFVHVVEELRYSRECPSTVKVCKTFSCSHVRIILVSGFLITFSRCVTCSRAARLVLKASFSCRMFSTCSWLTAFWLATCSPSTPQTGGSRGGSTERKKEREKDQQTEKHQSCQSNLSCETFFIFTAKLKKERNRKLETFAHPFFALWGESSLVKEPSGAACVVHVHVLCENISNMFWQKRYLSLSSSLLCGRSASKSLRNQNHFHARAATDHHLQPVTTQITRATLALLRFTWQRSDSHGIWRLDQLVSFNVRWRSYLNGVGTCGRHSLRAVLFTCGSGIVFTWRTKPRVSAARQRSHDPLSQKNGGWGGNDDFMNEWPHRNAFWERWA